MSLDSIEQNLPEEVKKALPYLMVGGGGALLGGLATGSRRKHDGEGRIGYAGRLAKNMGLAGLLAGGGAAALHKGYGAVKDSLDMEHPFTGKDADLSPVASLGKDLAFSPLTAGAAGLGMLAATRGGTKATEAAAQQSLSTIFKRVAGSTTAAMGRTGAARDEMIQDILRATKVADRPSTITRLHQAGLPTYGARAGSSINNMTAEGGATTADRLKVWAGDGKTGLNEAGVPGYTGNQPDKFGAKAQSSKFSLKDLTDKLTGKKPEPAFAGGIARDGTPDPDFKLSGKTVGSEAGATTGSGGSAGETFEFKNPNVKYKGPKISTNLPEAGTPFGGSTVGQHVDGKLKWKGDPLHKRLLRPAITAASSKTSNKLISLLEKAYRAAPGKLLGQTPARAIARGGLGLGAAALPSILGSLLTDRPE